MPQIAQLRAKQMNKENNTASQVESAQPQRQPQPQNKMRHGASAKEWAVRGEVGKQWKENWDKWSTEDWVAFGQKMIKKSQDENDQESVQIWQRTVSKWAGLDWEGAKEEWRKDPHGCPFMKMMRKNNNNFRALPKNQTGNQNQSQKPNWKKMAAEKWQKKKGGRNMKGNKHMKKNKMNKKQWMKKNKMNKKQWWNKKKAMWKNKGKGKKHCPFKQMMAKFKQNRWNNQHGKPPRRHCRVARIAMLLFLVLFPIGICCRKRCFNKNMHKRLTVLLDAENQQIYQQHGYHWEIRKDLSTLALVKFVPEQIPTFRNLNNLETTTLHQHTTETQLNSQPIYMS